MNGYTVTIDSLTPASCGTFRSRADALPTVRGLMADYYEAGCAIELDGLNWIAVDGRGSPVATIRVVPISGAVCKEVA